MAPEHPPSFTRFRVGRALCITSTVTYGLLTALIDVLDPHHLRNPEWPGHARFHLLWLISAGVLGALASIYLFWTATPRSPERIRTGALLGMIHIGGFFTAALFKSVSGAEFDADGRVLFGFIPPAALHLSTSAALLAAGVSLCRPRKDAT
ncbi:MAG: hypothetical protein QM820_17485 [Minicystis sp.]